MYFQKNLSVKNVVYGRLVPPVSCFGEASNVGKASNKHKKEKSVSLSAAVGVCKCV